MANVIVAYVLWLFGGWFGLHHLYLGRDNQALIWWSTFGGGFGIGWLRDFWRIPDYIQEANKSHDYVEDLKDRIRKKESPSTSFTRGITEVVFSAILANLVYAACPEDIINSYWIARVLFLAILAPLAAAYGVYMVANIGEHECGFKMPAIGSFLGVFFYWDDPTEIIYSSFIASTFLHYKGAKWKPLPSPEKRRYNCCKRTLKVTVWCSVYLVLCSSALYYNFKITTSDGEDIQFSEAMANFFNSPAWIQSKQSFWALYEYIQQNGWTDLYNELLKFLDPEGESNAYKVLELSESSPIEEIKAKYRKLVKQWHPDKHQDPVMKEEATKKFMEIQTAYDTLTKVRARRKKQEEEEKQQEEKEQQEQKERENTDESS